MASEPAQKRTRTSEVDGDDVVVCYHYPCQDGIFSALLAHLHFKGTSKKLRFFPMTVYKKHAPEELNLQGSETVYMLDIAGPRGFAAALAQRCRQVVVLDHHKTSMEDLSQEDKRPSNMKVVFDMSRSGATIARDYFQPKMSEPLATMIRMTEDGDLWRWQIPESKAFGAYLGGRKLEYDCNANPGIFDALLEIDVKAAVAEGEAILKEQDRKIDERLQQGFEISLGEADMGWGKCLAVRGDGLEDLRSEMGNRLARRSLEIGLRGVSCVAYQEPGLSDDSKIKLSFRALGEEDTTPISRHFGGGGHAKASSCVVAMELFETWRTCPLSVGDPSASGAGDGRK
eukprot:TRINITY_DN4826_c0_g1_i1.p1 TRINITY_DN4826_c0_g1~~TRINITY_DN4826_c0_g1_i1.p1  ORF type:complete len:343 (-),score=76.36 TRINITY_DN4826_c0_g1_i1:126-1154(-)